MITEEERNSIIEEAVNKAVEKALLALPTTMGSLMTNHVALNRLNKEFYAKHEEFKDHKSEVVSVIEKIEGNNPTMKYEDILEKAVPEIRTRINTLKNFNMNTVSKKPDRTFNDNGTI